jgi:hypothetical protein
MMNPVKWLIIGIIVGFSLACSLTGIMTRVSYVSHYELVQTGHAQYSQMTGDFELKECK